jgi:hypothetical protein
MRDHGEWGRYIRDGERFPDDREDWESEDYETFNARLEDENLDRLPHDDDEIDYSKIDVSRYLEQYQGQTGGTKTPGWRYDNTGHYAYVLFDGGAALRDEVISKLKAKGVSVQLHGRSYRPADNGKRYDWFLRVVETPDGEPRHPRRRVVASAFAQIPELRADEPEEFLELLDRVRKLEVDLERERRLSLRFYNQLAQAQGETNELLRRVEVSTSEAGALREERQTLAQRLERIGSENEAARGEVERLSGLLMEKDEQIGEKEDEIEALFSEAENIELRANEYRAKLEEKDEKLTDAQSKLDGLRRSATSQQDVVDVSRRASRRDEYLIGEILEQLLPNLRFLNRKRAVSTLLNEVKSPVGALKMLQRLNTDPGSFRSRPFRSAPQWREEHYNTGTDALGRLYYRDTGDKHTRKYEVHVSLKGAQNADEKLLKQYS